MFRRLIGPGGHSTGGPRRRTANPLRVETLECREVPALFAAAADVPVGEQPFDAAAGDFNGDGKADVAVLLSSSSASVNVLLGDGRGGLQTAPGAPFPVGFDARSMTAADFDGDGRTDLAVPIYFGTPGRGVRVYLAGAGGQFGEAAGSPFSIPHYAEFVATADFNNDGRPDLVVNSREGSFDTDLVSVLLGTGTGGFGPAHSFSVGPAPFAVGTGDFTDDGNQDVVVANNRTLTLDVYPGDGQGGFGGPVSSATGMANYTLSVAADFNGDGHADLAVGGTIAGFPDPSENLMQVFLGNGAGALVPAPGGPLPGAGSNGVVVADFNRDGRLDVAGVGNDESTLYAYLGTGGGFVAAPGSPYAVGANPRAVVVGHFNSDRRPDLVTANGSAASISVLLSARRARAAVDVRPGSPVNPINLGSHGVLPVAILTTPGFNALDVSAATVRLGDPRLSGGVAPVRVVREDVDGDGDLDLLLVFRVRDLVVSGAIDCGTTHLKLTGSLTDGTEFFGRDRVRVVP